MQIYDLIQLVRAVQRRANALDEEQFDRVKMKDTRTEQSMYEQACLELVAEKEWREIIRVLAQGGEYYSVKWPS